MSKISILRTTDGNQPQVEEHVAANSAAFTNNVNFTAVAAGVATVLAGAGAIYGIAGDIRKTFAADNETVAQEKVSLEVNIQDFTFVTEHAVAQLPTIIGGSAELATANTLTIGSGSQFIITDVRADEAGDLKVLEFRAV